MAKKCCIVTGSRADYGLLEPLIEIIDKNFNLNLIVTGSHLSKQFGETVKYIKYKHKKVPILVDDDTSVGISKSMGLALIGFADVFDKPDFVLVLGDRFEIFAAIIAAYNQQIPIAHIEGGEFTTGSLDNGYRHCITQLADIHFVATEQARHHLRNRKNVYHVGSLGCVFPEPINEQKCWDYIVVFHPEKTNALSLKNFQAILDVTKNLENVFYLGSNADAGGRIINRFLEDYLWYWNVPRNKYIELLRNAKAIIGNSSSGIIEAPSLKTATINVGDRQKGREMAKSVINCGGTVEEIKEAIEKTKEIDWAKVKNPYAKKGTIKNILAVLGGI